KTLGPLLAGFWNELWTAAGTPFGKKCFSHFHCREGCKSGLIGTPGKRVCAKAYREFESLPFRKKVRSLMSGVRSHFNNFGTGRSSPHSSFSFFTVHSLMIGVLDSSCWCIMK